MFCQNCGATLTANIVFCPACGQQQPMIEGTAPPPLPLSSEIVPVAPFMPPAFVKADGGRWIGLGWDVVKSDLGLFMGMTLISVLIGSAVPIILHGSMQAGMHIAMMRKLVRGRTEIGDLFLGFNFFLPTLLAALAISAFSFVGLLLCIFPALLVGTVFMFTYVFIVDKRMEFWPAMQASHEVVKRDYMGFVLFFLAIVALNIAGFLCCIAGLLVTIPITYAAITIAYRELVGFDPNTV